MAASIWGEAGAREMRSVWAGTGDFDVFGQVGWIVAQDGLLRARDGSAPCAGCGKPLDDGQGCGAGGWTPTGGVVAHAGHDQGALSFAAAGGRSDVLMKGEHGVVQSQA